MSNVATMNENSSLQLPEDLAGQFQPADRFIVWVDGDTIHLKRLLPSAVDVVERAPLDSPLSLDEINDIVHEVRRQRRAS